MHPDLKEIIITEEKIQSKIKELAGQISEDYKDKDLLMLVILRGGVMFLADLSRNLTINTSIDFMAVTRYSGSMTPSNEVKIIKDLDKPIEDKDVLIIEDIIDNGKTLSFLTEHLKHRKPRSIKICTLLDKPERRKTSIQPDYNGFVIPDKFVVGYGLDYKQRYRNLPYIGVMKQEIYSS
ncbi:MAG: hypoxanthine phosphoribosyltransferase [Armatimonadota bacterium]